jgi:hypothetical protein
MFGLTLITEPTKLSQSAVQVGKKAIENPASLEQCGYLLNNRSCRAIMENDEGVLLTLRRFWFLLRGLLTVGAFFLQVYFNRRLVRYC